MGERATCDDSGQYVGLAPGHFTICAACGKSVPVTRDHRLSRHAAPSREVESDG